MVEYWNIGIMGKSKKNLDTLSFHSSVIPNLFPTFHYSNIPLSRYFIKTAPENPVLWTGMKGASAESRKKVNRDPETSSA